MVEQEFDLIIGLHSIQAVLNNPNRKIRGLFSTKESLKDLKNLCSEDKITILNNHEVQEEGKNFARQLGYQLARVPSNICLVADTLKVHDITFLDNCKRILCVDSISDVHNAAAIMRTADFFGVEAIVIPQKKTFGLSPAFFRMASGATETLPIVRTSQLNKLIRKLKDGNWNVTGLSEHAKMEFKKSSNEKSVLIVGAEDIGLSNAVLRECDQVMALNSQGKIQSLNVSVAAAIALEKCFG